MNYSCSRSRSPATDERHQHSDGNHGAYDHRPGRKVEPERREQAGGVAEDADAIGLEIASVPLIEGREGGPPRRDKNKKEPHQLHRDGPRAGEEDIEADPPEPLAKPEP